jgi:hypothetical protein
VGACGAEQTNEYKGPDTQLYTKTGAYAAHYKKKHGVKKKNKQQHFIELFTTGIGLLQRGKTAALVEAAALECLAVIPFVAVHELDVEQQVGNTCAPRALITALESMNCPTELDIDQRAEGVGAAWIERHLEACDRKQRIHVIDTISRSQTLSFIT